MKPFQNRVCLLFGGTGAIGYSIAEKFYQNGAKIGIVGRSLEQLEKQFQSFEEQDRIALIEAPSLSSAEIQSAVEQVQSQFGTLHHLIHSVGIGTPASLLDVTEEEFDHMINVNLKSAFLACKHAVPVMLVNGGGSTIVLISSLASIQADKNMLPYATSKTALTGAGLFHRRGLRTTCPHQRAQPRSHPDPDGR